MTVVDGHDPLLPPEAPENPDGPAPTPDDRVERQRPNKTKQQANKWMRWVHVYVSMFALLIVLFFGITGLTLNHPAWTFGDELEQTTLTGTLPDSVVVDGELELLLVSEFFREEHDVAGDLSSFNTAPDSGSLAYRGPGYSADALFEIPSLDYTVTVQQQGFVAVMNDLHKGRDTGSAWSWVIDISAGLLVVISITGLAIQFLMRKRRTQAFIVAGVGSVVTVLLVWITTV